MNRKRILGGLLGASLLLSACGGAVPAATAVPAAAASALPTTTAGTPVPTAVSAPAATVTMAAATATNAAQATALEPPLTQIAPATSSATAAPPAAATATTRPATATTGPAAAGPLTRVRLALDWTPNTNHTGFYVAQARGFYKAQGIDLQILPYSDAISPDALVAAGQADFAISFVEQMVIDRATGLPVESVAAIIQHNTSELVTLKGSGIDRPAKLEGTRYAAFGSDYEEPVIARVIKCDGGKTGTIRSITTSTAGLQALEGKQADFVWIYKGWEAIQARHDGFALNEFLVRDFCVPDYPSPVIIAGESFLQHQAAVGRRFMAATAQGFQFAIAHPDEAADLLIAGNPPDSFPDKALIHESARYLAGQYQAEAPRWGVQTLQQWSGYPEFMVAAGKLEDANHKAVTSLDYASLFTNALLPAP